MASHHFLCTHNFTGLAPLAHLAVPTAEPLLDEAPDRLPAEDVPGAAAHVALLHDHLVVEPEVDRVAGVPVGQERPEVVDHDVGVVVRLQEPVRLTPVALVDVPEGLLRLAPEAAPVAAAVQLDGWQTLVGLCVQYRSFTAPTHFYLRRSRQV